MITGGPGTGKHTVGRMVADRLGLELADLGEVAAGAGLVDGRTGEVDAGRLREAAAPLLGPRSLVVGHMAPYALDPARVRLAVVLRRSPYELGPVYAARGYPAGKASQNLQAEILGVTAHDAAALLGAGRTVQLDSTGRPAGEVAGRACAAAAGARGGDGVDWLALVAGRGDLRRFFSYD